jgi:hypothetical protein
MKLTVDTVVIRKKWTVYGPAYSGTHRGSGYCEDHFDRQYLTKQWKLFGICVWSCVLDYEDVPVYASVQVATMGFTDWKSEFKDYIT